MADGLVGIDIGTSSVKVLIVRPDGHVLGQASRPYETCSPRAGWAEQDPDVWVVQTYAATADALRAAQAQDRSLVVRSVGFTGQMHSFVLLDADGAAIRPAITWMDSRAHELVPEATRLIESHALLERVQNLPAPGLTLLPLLWLARNEPESVKQTRALLLAKDYVRYRMTGRIATDTTDASGTLLMDMPRRAWLTEIGAVPGIPAHILPDILEPWEQAGLTLGLPVELKQIEGIPAAAGSADQQAAALANGILSDGQVQIMLGTGSQIATPVSECPRVFRRTLNVFCHHTGWLLQGSIQNAGSALSWIKKLLGADWSEFETADLRVEAALGAASSPLFVPYLTGERTPVMNPAATGAWMGLRQSSGRSDMLYAGMEGVVFGIVDALEEVLSAMDGDDIDIKVGGGGVQSEAYLQLLADSSGRTLHVLSEPNTTAIGAALLGGVAAGVFSDLATGVASMGVQSDRTVHPDIRRHHTLIERRGQWAKAVETLYPRERIEDSRTRS